MEVEKNFKPALQEVMDEFYSRLEKASIHMLNEVDEKITGPRTGAEYRVPSTARKYTASAPGEPPAVRTGDLRRHMSYQLKREGSEIFSAIGNKLEYANYLEHGTTDAMGQDLMAPRPFLSPTFEEQRETIMRILGGEVTWV